MKNFSHTSPAPNALTPEGLRNVKLRLSRIALLILESDIRYGFWDKGKREEEEQGEGEGEGKGESSVARTPAVVSSDESIANGTDADKSIDELVADVFQHSEDGRLAVNLDEVNEDANPTDAYVNPIHARTALSASRTRSTHPSRLQLASALGVDASELEDIVQQVESTYGENIWEMLILAGRTELALESKAIRVSKWDSLESLAVSKLHSLVMRNAVKSAGELLAIAAAANRAVRHNPQPNASQHEHNSAITMNIFSGVAGDGVDNMSNKKGDDPVPRGNLPGVGSLGTIQLSLAPRVRKQLTAPKDSVSRVLQDSKMLSADDLREMVKSADEKNREHNMSKLEQERRANPEVIDVDVFEDLD